MGDSALQSNTIGVNNVAIGEDALNTNTVGDHNIAIGHSALYSNTTGDSNIAIGEYALNSNDGDDNIAIGKFTLMENDGDDNIALGYNALVLNTEGNYNIAIGKYVLQDNTKGDDNIAIGKSALSINTVGDHNIAVGKESGITITTGSGNTFLGAYSDASTGTLSNSTAIGYGATVTLSNTIQLGNSDVNLVNTSATVSATAFVGDGSGLTNIGTSSNNNIAIGVNALKENVDGTFNVAIGTDALDKNGGKYNTAIGGQASKNHTGLENTTAIGYNANIHISNSVRLGNTSVQLITGQVGFTSASDRRLKENIKGTKYGLDEILKLEPVDYTLKLNGLKQVGFIAQDVKPLIPEVVSGVEGDIEKGETLGITYTSLIPVLTKAIQEQQTIISRLEKMLLSSLERQEVIEKELIEIRSSIKQ